MLDKFYVGYSGNLEKRLLEHNAGVSTYTSKEIDWELEWSKSYTSCEKAMEQEKIIKSKRAENILNG